MNGIWRILAPIDTEQTWTRFRACGLMIGLVVGVVLVTVGLVGTWRDNSQHMTQTVETSPGTATDGHLTIRLQSSLPGR